MEAARQATAGSGRQRTAARRCVVSMVQLVCPDGAVAGDVITLDTPAGEVEVVIPGGVSSGESFEYTAEQQHEPSPASAPRAAAPLPQPPRTKVLRIGFLGNSLTYYNDLPHLVQNIVELNCNVGAAASIEVQVGACLRGGQSLPSLFAKGAAADGSRPHKCIGSRDMYATVTEMLSAPGGWDYVVFTDHSQGPARVDEELPAVVASCTPNEVSRGRTLASLETSYAPLFKQAGATVVIMQTWGYCKDAKQSEEIGGFETMSTLLAEGYEIYAAALRHAGVPTQVAPVGGAFHKLWRADRGLWAEMYQHDGFHPKALGSFLAASHLCATILSHRWATRPGSGQFISLPSVWPEGVPTYAAADGIPQAKPQSSALARVIELAGPAGTVECVMRRPTPAAPLVEATWFDATLWKSRQ